MNLWHKLGRLLRLSAPAQRSPVDPALVATASKIAEQAAPIELDDRSLSDAPIVVYDLETSGLNVNEDTVLAIGAVTIKNGAIALGDVFLEVLAAPAHLNRQSQLIHGLTHKDLAAGSPPGPVLLRFLEYSTNRIWAAYHAEFDRVMLQKALVNWLGVTFDPRPLDITELAPMLFPAKGPASGPLDHWLQAFGLTVSERHNALADAMVTAELMLILLDRAHQQGYRTWGELRDAVHHWRQLQRHLP